MTVRYDILVAGGGVAGLAAAAAFSSAGRRVLCVDAAPAEAGLRDTRTTAVLRPGVDLLTRAGVWPRLDGEVAALRTMRLIDAGGPRNRAREVADFDAEETAGSDDAPLFGWNAPNAALRRALRERLDELPGATLRAETAVEGLLARRDEAVATLTGGETVRARLAIGADG
ncbi:MAG: FAD-dependent monooxygenase, partial [Pseudomonadota bacterium]